MKTIIATAAATLFATSVGAADIYKDMGTGNPDLPSQRVGFADVVATQPSIGDSIDRYHGFGDDNPDVSSFTGKGPTITATPSGSNQVIYVGPGREL